jgi:hypothetical protein
LPALYISGKKLQAITHRIMTFPLYIYAMNLSAFKESLSAGQPPGHASVYLQALWYDAKDNWNKAHELIQDLPDKKASWIHAYLHRKEGDNRNADYWYGKAGRKRPSVSFNEEWEQLANAFLLEKL